MQASVNRFAVVVMAYLGATRTRDQKQRLAWKLRLVRMLYERGYNREEVVALFRFIDWLLILPAGREEEFRDEIERMEKGEKMGVGRMSGPQACTRRHFRSPKAAWDARCAAASVAKVQTTFGRRPKMAYVTSIEYGTTSGSPDTIVDVGSSTTTVVENLTAGVTHYFQVATYDAQGQSGPLSTEVDAVPLADATAMPTPTTASGEVPSAEPPAALLLTIILGLLLVAAARRLIAADG
ncbi:MAG: fibronectin type III domain-containing protein [Candidatus Schekmanbacteria bacterium]|nr:fibronectin type III domain-containing protein [Candidatus Schekmanbacteria bacterium]